jgi:2-polyprenyl-6-methoxyphenol hydroxylase-like FAD-dependent oxidoreductase
MSATGAAPITSIKRIAIAGAGIGGLSFALSLRRWCILRSLPLPHITIFERDINREARLDQVNSNHQTESFTNKCVALLLLALWYLSGS